jgi:hypothetical protein
VSEGVHEKPVIDAQVARKVDAPAEDIPAEERARLSGYKRRFAIIYLGLALAAGVALGALIVVASDDDGSTQAVQTAGSEFHPNGSPNARVSEIAARVASRYRGEDGQQLVAAISGPPLVVFNQPEGSTQVLVGAVAIRPTIPAGGAVEPSEIEVVDTTNAVQFVLCGYGESCSIAAGQPSEARHLLLRREALELALYTFKYLGGVDNVIVYLPPLPGGQAPPHVVFLRRGELGSQLGKPLTETLSAKKLGVGQIPRSEIPTLNRLTGTRFYRYAYTPSQVGGAVLFLDPVTAP